MKLFDHQKTGIEFLKKNQRAILADEMGIGKTIQAIKAVEGCGGTIVICPASIKTNWEREILANDDSANIDILSGRKASEQIIKIDWLIINYDIVAHRKDELMGMIKSGVINNIILDEAHYIKGKSKRAIATLELTGKAEKVYCLTGTPLLNRPIELWHLLVAINHPLTIENGARTIFSKKYCGGFLKVIPPSKWRPMAIRFWDESGATNLNELRKNLIGYMLRRKKDQVLDLPDKIIDVMRVELTSKQRIQYASAFEEYIDYLRENPPEHTSVTNVLAARQLVEIQKLKQVCSQAKTERIVNDTLNAVSQGQKVIIFSQYKKTVSIIQEEIKKKKIKTVELTGSTKSEDRQKAVDSFQNDRNVKVFIANIKAGGVGITLTKANIVIFADMDWTPEIHSQAEDRAHRIGQAGTVNVYYYVAEDTIEMDIIELLANKKKVVSEVIDGTKNRVSNKSILVEFMQRMNSRVLREEKVINSCK